METADLNRGTTPVRYASDYYNATRDVLASNRCDLEADLARASDPTDRSRIAKAIETNQRLHEENENGWRRSPTRRNFMRKHSGADLENLTCEKRFQPYSSGSTTMSQPTSEKKTGKVAVMSGLSAVTEQLSHDLGGFREKIKKGIFAPRLKDDIILTWQHDSGNLIARTTAGTLNLWESDRGLEFKAEMLPWHTMSSDLVKLIHAGNVFDCSFAFSVKRDSWVWARKPGDLDERTIIEFDTLYDVGPVCRGAYPQTTVQVDFVGRDAGEPRIRPENIPAHNARILRLMRAQARLGQEPCEPDLETMSNVDCSLALDIWNEWYDDQKNKPISPEQKRQMAVRLRKAERIINRNTAALS